jgi:hypothetical protein
MKCEKPQACTYGDYSETHPGFFGKRCYRLTRSLMVRFEIVKPFAALDDAHERDLFAGRADFCDGIAFRQCGDISRGFDRFEFGQHLAGVTARVGGEGQDEAQSQDENEAALFNEFGFHGVK